MKTKLYRAMRSGKRGQAMVIVALAMVAIVGASALAVDVGNFALMRAKMQKAADAAALAGAGDLYSGASTGIRTARTYATLNGYANDPNVTTSGATDAGVTVTTPYDGDADTVGVTISQTATAFFAGVLGLTRFDMSVRSAAENRQRWVPPSDTGTLAGVMPFAISTSELRREFEDEENSWSGGYFHEEVEMEYEYEHGQWGYEDEGGTDDDEQRMIPLTSSGDYYSYIVGKDPSKQFSVTVGQTFDVPTVDMVWPTYQGIRQRMIDQSFVTLIPVYQSIGSDGDHDEHENDEHGHRWITQVTIVGFLGIEFPAGPYADTGDPNPQPLPNGSDTSPGTNVLGEYNFAPSGWGEFMEGEFEVDDGSHDGGESELEIENEDGAGPKILGYWTATGEFYDSYPGSWSSGSSMNGHNTNQPGPTAGRVRLKQ